MRLPLSLAAASRRALALAGLAAGVTLAAATTTFAAGEFSATQKAGIEKIVHDYLVNNPEVIREAIDELEKRQKAAEAASREKVLDEQGDKLLHSANQAVVGNPDGDVTLVEFFDYNCGYCKQLRQTLQQIDNLTVYTFPLPILSPDSTQKVRNVWCAKDRGAVWDAWMLKGQVPPKADDCDVPVDKMLALGQQLSVRGTPAIFFANGSRVPGAISQKELEQRLQAP